MSEKTTQPLDNAEQSGLVSSCQENADTFDAMAGAAGYGPRTARDPAACGSEGGGLRPGLTPPSPSRERHSPPSETRVGGGRTITLGVGGGTAPNRGVGKGVRREVPPVPDAHGSHVMLAGEKAIECIRKEIALRTEAR